MTSFNRFAQFRVYNGGVLLAPQGSGDRCPATTPGSLEFLAP